MAAKETGGLRAQCRTGKGGRVELDVLDISAGGCMVDRRSWSVQAGERVLVKLPGLAYQPGEVVWVEDNLAGIAFEQVLHDAVLVHLKAGTIQAA